MENKFIDWDDILYNLKHQKTIVFLGPNAYLTPDNKPIETILLEEIGARDPENPYIKAYYEDGFFLLKEKKFRRRLVRQIKDFYNSQTAQLELFLNKLSRIPFHIYILMTPDQMLANAFKKLNLPFYQDVYNMGQPAGSFTPPMKEMPLVYNMLGSFSNNESLVLTHNDLFDYLKSIFIGKSMPIGLKEALYDVNQYMFLGLSFDKWYLQLLLRILDLHTQELEHLERIATKSKLPIQENLFKEQFSMEFIPDEAEVFIHHLYDKCEKAGMLRESNVAEMAAQNVNIEDIYKHIGMGDNTKAMDEFMGMVRLMLPRTEEIRKDLLVLMNEFQNIEKKFMLGTDDAYTGKERNRIITAFLDLIEHFKSMME